MDLPSLVILDRDGVINEDSPDFIRSPDAWRPIAGSLEAIASLTQAGVEIAIATNQSGVARGHFDLETLDSIHARMDQAIKAAGGRVATIAYCPHGPEDDCACRKPEPGLLHQIERISGLSVSGQPFVGDAVRDLEAGRRAGCRPVLVRTGKGRATEQDAAMEDVEVFDDLAAFAAHLLGEERN